MSEGSTQRVARITDPVSIGKLKLPNRLIKAATYEGMTPRGRSTEQLTDFHRKMVQGGVGLTTVAYASVSPDGRTHEDQLLLDRENEVNLRRLANELHNEGGLVSIQITHCGYFTRNRKLSTRTPGSASRVFNSYGALMGLPLSHSMSKAEMLQVVDQFREATELVVACGFDAIELHMGHGYLLSQFISPATNRRKDKYGGSSTSRFKFPAEVLEAVKRAAGDVPVIVKMNVSDGFKGGLEETEASDLALMIEEHGADSLVTSGGFTSKSPFFLMRGEVPWRGMISVEKHPVQKIAIGLFGPFIMKQYRFSENYFATMADVLPQTVSIPVFYSGGAISSQGIASLLQNGFAGIAAGRALIHDNALLKSISTDPEFKSACNHCNQCMVQMDKGGVKCVIKT